MPIPTPNKNEKKNEFISRCVITMIKETKNLDQALAICYKSWRENENKN